MGSFAIGPAVGENNNDKVREKQVTKLQEENEQIMTVFNDMTTEIQSPVMEFFSETFQITAITDEGFHGETANGFGEETIYYKFEDIEQLNPKYKYKLGDYMVIRSMGKHRLE
ncbi:hypothetical protein [Lysinibacillus xylanilyticus]|uniref:hypothetical protein n=1 Tax=Lysinibacillus xylanilyticus TaxID=582475 RepID=UPI003CFC838F